MNFEYSDDQLDAITRIEQWYKKCKKQKGTKTFRLYGPAGSGKTSIIPAVIESLNIKVVQYLAPTGMAVLALKDRGVDGALTIHKALYILPKKINEEYVIAKNNLEVLQNSLLNCEDKDEYNLIQERIDTLSKTIEELKKENELINLKEKNLEWILNPNSILIYSDLIVCDEASMIDSRMRKDIESFKKPVIYIGDPNQLLPINYYNDDNVMFNKSGDIIPPDYSLSSIHRQAYDNPILRYSQKIIHDDMDDEDVFHLSSENDFFIKRVNLDDYDILEDLVNADQLLCGFNKTRKNINSYMHYNVFQYQTEMPDINEKIVIKRNNYDYDVFNGEVVRIIKIHHDKKLRVQNPENFVFMEVMKRNKDIVKAWFVRSNFIDDTAKVYVPKSITPKPIVADFGWVITTHNAQGSEWDYGIILDDRFGRTREDYYRWLYTAVTRFKKGLVIVNKNN